jgi:hypothetical protein
MTRPLKRRLADVFRVTGTVLVARSWRHGYLLAALCTWQFCGSGFFKYGLLFSITVSPTCFVLYSVIIREINIRECLFIYFLSYLLTPWRRVLLEKLAGSQLVKKFPAFYGTRRSITAFTSARHQTQSWAPFQCSGRTKGSGQARGTCIRFVRRPVFRVSSC